MSAPFPIAISSEVRKRPLVGSRGKGEGSGGPDPEDLEIAPPSALLRETHSIDRCPDLATADNTQQNPESVATTVAKSVLHQVKESPNAYPPLKSIAGYLWHILDSCEVWSPSHIFNLCHLQLLQQTMVNQQAIALLAPRIRILSESLREPFTTGDVNERRREEEREGELEQ